MIHIIGYLPIIINISQKFNFYLKKVRSIIRPMENDNSANSNYVSKIDFRSRLGKGKKPLKKLGNFLSSYKFRIGGVIFSIALIGFMAVAIYHGYFMDSATTPSTKSHTATLNKTDKIADSNIQQPTIANPSPSDNPSPSGSVLGTTDSSSSDETTYAAISPTVEISPLPTDIPEPTATPDTSSNTSSNSNCTTGSGVPNAWYSDVYPASPISASNGSATLTVNIRDCSINNVSSSSTIKISLNSGDSNTQVNGQSLPTTITTQNGQASFTVTSQVAGTVSLTIQDTTDSFGVTDTNNSNPSIVFDGSSEAPTPTDAVSPTQTISPTSAISPTP
jgi:hypothetical protein